MDEQKQVPNEIKALAQQVSMTPLDWWIHPDRIVIVFVEGPKRTFTREKKSPMIEELKEATSEAIPSAPSAPSAASTPPPTGSGSKHSPRKKTKGKE